ncbi:hypothetical protein CRE_27844 [Caenorhabditis remanei]|uniref:DUF19 domain-containing protein n=1 Tax=Caenorhabditis remanei TaxID=31234 RepID=E3NDK7_CAERE|nr:hypothetical protein CRE_27844 [Caenorhabditis remanei]
MRVLPSILILSSILLPIGADFRPCPYMTPECRPKMLELRSLLTFDSNSTYPPVPDMYNLTKSLCQEAEHCLAHCWALEDYGKACESLGTRVHKFETECVKYALSMVYDYNPHKPECSEKYDFFTTDPLLKKKVFAEGKECFLNPFYSNPCEQELRSKYDSLMSLYLTPSEDGKYNSPYDKFQKFQCEVLLQKLDSAIADMNSKNSINATKLVEMAQRSQNCIDNTCLIKPKKTEKIGKVFNITLF